MKCKNCGADLSSEAIFCQECGVKNSEKRFCEECYSLVSDSDTYCRHCGTKISGYRPKVNIFSNDNLQITLHCPDCGKAHRGKLICGKDELEFLAIDDEEDKED